MPETRHETKPPNGSYARVFSFVLMLPPCPPRAFLAESRRSDWGSHIAIRLDRLSHSFESRKSLSDFGGALVQQYCSSVSPVVEAQKDVNLLLGITMKITLSPK